MKTITCVACDTEIYELVTAIEAGDAITPYPFRGVNGFDDPTDGDEIACPNCGSREGIARGIERTTGLSVPL